MSQFLAQKRDYLWPTVAATIVLIVTAAAVFGFGRAFLLSRPVLAVVELTLTEPLASADGTEPPTPLQLKAIERWVAAQASDQPPTEAVLDRVFTAGNRPSPDSAAVRGPSGADLAVSLADESATNRSKPDLHDLLADTLPDAQANDHVSSDPLASKLDALGLPSALTPGADASRAWLTVRAEYVPTQHAIAVMLTARGPEAGSASSTVEQAAKRYASYAAQRYWREAQAASIRAEAEHRAAQEGLESAKSRLTEAIRRKEAFESAAEAPIETPWQPASSPASEQEPSSPLAVQNLGPAGAPDQPAGDPQDAGERRSLGRRIELLKLRRTFLLGQLTPSHPKIEQIDRELAELEAQLAELPPESPLIWAPDGRQSESADLPDGETTNAAMAAAQPGGGDAQAGPAALGREEQSGQPAGASAGRSFPADASRLAAECAEAAAAVEQAEHCLEQAERRRQLCRFALNNPLQSTLGPMRVSDPSQLFRTLALWPLAALAGGLAILSAALFYALAAYAVQRHRAAIVVASVEHLEQLTPLPVISLVAAGGERS